MSMVMGRIHLDGRLLDALEVLGMECALACAQGEELSQHGEYLGISQLRNDVLGHG